MTGAEQRFLDKLEEQFQNGEVVFERGRGNAGAAGIQFETIIDGCLVVFRHDNCPEVISFLQKVVTRLSVCKIRSQEEISAQDNSPFGDSFSLYEYRRIILRGRLGRLWQRVKRSVEQRERSAYESKVARLNRQMFS